MPKYLKTPRIVQNAKHDVLVNLDAVVTAAPNEVVQTATNVTTVDGKIIAIDNSFESIVKILGNDIIQ
jgi:hypothetical protein